MSGTSPLSQTVNVTQQQQSQCSGTSKGISRSVEGGALSTTALLLIYAILIISAVWFMFHVVAAQLAAGTGSFGDFPALWSYGRIQITHPASLLYDFSGLQAAQVALGMSAEHHYPFPYPPPALFLLRPLGLMPYDWALVIWISGQLGFYVWAVTGDDGGVMNHVRRDWKARLAMAAALVLTPTAALTVVEGQSGFLAAALLVGGIRRAASRPVLGGILLGLLIYKPQFGLLVPFALVAAGLWRCAGSACLTTLTLAVASCMAFGWDIWLVWYNSLSEYQAWFGGFDPLMPTVTSNLRLLNVPDGIGQAAQWAVAMASAAAVWRCFRGGCGIPGVAVLVAATCLANPHEFVYDLPMLDAAVLLLVAHRLETQAVFNLVEVLVLIVVLLFPLMMVLTVMPFSAVILAAFLALGARHVQDYARSQATSS
jgi:Glycosyltransferase family 87